LVSLVYQGQIMERNVVMMGVSLTVALEADIVQ
jgi:hypothetical protein